ncbi:SGNH/GDSL hydrolase family protein [Pseudonocardiaceae bacterium YIM PH 21723]|nr:SGNH/GDSL hydrolase family protein [Pseudonocardiaceae bacterium YIM PH 21723]
METGATSLLVLADSLAFHGPAKAMPADEPRLWCNIAAAELGCAAELFAGFGWTTRDAWWALTKDPRLWARLPHASVVVLAVGNMDTLPSPLPSYLREGLRYLRPDWLRRWGRKAYLWAQPRLAKAWGGRPVALPPRVSVRYLEDCRSALLAVRPDLRVIAILPGVHRAPAYAGVHTGYLPQRRAIQRWAHYHRVPLLDLAALIGGHVLSGQGNPDGMHWGWAGHEIVGRACAALIREVTEDGRSGPVSA